MKNYEAIFLKEGVKGFVFYSEKEDKNLTAQAYHYGRKIKTERIVAISTGKKDVQAKYILRVTILK
jgi:hypothetical protein